ncbi:MAG: N-formylglutamate amidohydrolase [Rickettsiales bacterium]|nr:N-formylglutamate amidohydrolase [Rickettsiales bacterium]|tara:strand:+ start:573 stop:1376 length:804 start_codon:yes stop_codon:yes gene_type:complete
MRKNNYIFIKKVNYKVPLLFCCDHASNLIPPDYKNLGLNKNILNKHVAIDIGAKHLTKELSKKFYTNYIIAKYSRLFIDLNRDPKHKNLIPTKSDGISIKKNKNLSKKELIKRIKFYHESYHKKLSSVLKEMDKKFNCKTTLICIHSFTPALKNCKNRPWDVGLLYRDDKRIYTPMMKHLKNIKNLKVGSNLPYSGYDDVNYTMALHGEKQNRPFISIEIKNDLFEKKNKKRLKYITDSITLSIYKSQISLKSSYAMNMKKINIIGI